MNADNYVHMHMNKPCNPSMQKLTKSGACTVLSVYIICILNMHMDKHLCIGSNTCYIMNVPVLIFTYTKLGR